MDTRNVKYPEWVPTKLERYMEKNPGTQWGDILRNRGPSSDDHAHSLHRSSSGRTSSIQRKGGRKAREAHYTRKAILERQKEEARRARWEEHHPLSSESAWRRREARRKTRKAAERAARKR